MPSKNKIFEGLQAALLDAITESEFDRLVRFSLEIDRSHITLGNNLTIRVFDVIAWAIRHDKLDALIKKASETSPKNPKLKRFLNSYNQSRKLTADDIPEINLRRTYLKRVVTQADHFLFFSDIAGASSPFRLSLQKLYTPLLIRRPNWHDELRDERRDNEPTAESVVQQESQYGYTSLLEQANRHQHLLILGGPGSGKSSFVKFLALCMAGELLSWEDINISALTRDITLYSPTSEEEDQAIVLSEQTQNIWEHGGLLPSYVSLQNFAADDFDAPSTKATAEQFMKYLESILKSADLGDFVNDLRDEWHAKGGLLLIDGLDEIPNTDGQRLWIEDAVIDFMASYPNVRIIITSRPYAAQRESNQLAAFHRVSIAPFTMEQIQMYIARAYPHLQGHGMSDPLPTLQSLLSDRSSLSQLAQTPLMLALIVSILAQNRGTLIARREEIYEQSVNLFLSAWEEPKQNSHAREPHLESVKKDDAAIHKWIDNHHDLIRIVLEKVAYASLQNQAGLESNRLLDEDKLLGAIARATSDDTSIHPARVTQYLLERSGIVFRQVNGYYQFPHPTIHEYLAACYLYGLDNYVRRIIRLLTEDPQRWRDVLLFSAAKKARTEVTSAFALIARLCPNTAEQDNIDNSIEKSALLTMLSGRILLESDLANSEDLDEHDLAIIRQVREMLAQLHNSHALSMSDRLTASLDLGELGDLRAGVGLHRAGLPSIEWHSVAPGPFLLGTELTSNGGRSGGNLYDLLKNSYEISRYPITVLQYSAFVDADGYHQKEFWTAAGWAWRQGQHIESPAQYTTFPTTPNQPQVGISWYEAVAFCKWLSTELHEDITLPSEIEWERAARGTDGRNFPWGSDFTIFDCNMRWTGIGHPSPVGMFPKNESPCGAFDMAGNVWEWCVTKWQSSLKNFSAIVHEDMVGSQRRVLRGGSWANKRRFVRCAYRHRDFPDHRGPNVGFRVVRR